jgi:hypothetical protein
VLGARGWRRDAETGLGTAYWRGSQPNAGMGIETMGKECDATLETSPTARRYSGAANSARISPFGDKCRVEFYSGLRRDDPFS